MFASFKNQLGDHLDDLNDMVEDGVTMVADKVKSETSPQKIGIASAESSMNKSQRWMRANRFDKWSNYDSVFNDLTEDIQIDTKNGIITLLMTYDTSLVLSVNKINDGEYIIQQWSLQTYEVVHEEKFEGDYIKMYDI